MTVAPLAGAWIETFAARPGRRHQAVAPLAGAWIETQRVVGVAAPRVSLPSRERGLKQKRTIIECKAVLSLPSRERGLKRVNQTGENPGVPVAPLAGAWIETVKLRMQEGKDTRRSPRGSGD